MIFNVSGGGGTALNFRVVGGTTAPSNPKENMIWVNTSTKITSYIFSATQPTGSAGMVWITTGTSSTCEFNALKKNGIQVYPLSAKQYVSGAWVDKTAKSYQSGEWVDWITYLYNAGDECTDITGGWEAVSWRYYANTNAAVPNVTRNTENIQISFTNTGAYKDGCLKTRNKISVTNANKIGLSCNSNDFIHVGHLTLVSDKSSAIAAENVATATFLDTAANLEIDVSKITGSYYVCVGIVMYDNREGTLTINDIYME